MFVRFRETARSLQCTLIETRRVDGKVRHEHIANLGSTETPLTVSGRIAFWQRVNERLGRLSNRVVAAAQGKIRGDIHARIPMVTLHEQRALQLENAEADERFWSSLQHMNASTAEGHKGLLAKTQRTISDSEASAKDAAANAERAKERIAKIERGEDVAGGLGNPVDFETMLRKAGMSDEDIQHCKDMAELRLSHEELEKLVDEQLEAGDRAGRAIVRRWLRERRGGPPSADVDPPSAAT